MTPENFLDYFVGASAKFAGLVTADVLDRPVAHLGWTVRDLVGHLGGVYAYLSLIHI